MNHPKFPLTQVVEHVVVIVFQSLRCVRLFVTSWTAALQASLSFTISQSLCVCSNSCPLSPLCYLTISFPATPFSFCLQSLQASGSFPISQFIAPNGQSAYMYIYIYYWFCFLKTPAQSTCQICLVLLKDDFILFTECNILQLLIRSCCLITLLKTSIPVLNFSTCVAITEKEELKFELYVWSFLFPTHTIYNFFISIFISSVFKCLHI